MEKQIEVQTGKGKVVSRNFITAHLKKFLTRNQDKKVAVNTLPASQGAQEAQVLKWLFRNSRAKSQENVQWRMFEKTNLYIAEDVKQFLLCDENGKMTFPIKKWEFYRKVVKENLNSDILLARNDGEEITFSWFDLCSGPTEKNLGNILETIKSYSEGSIFYITFLLNGRREKSWAAGLERKAEAKEIQKYIKARFQYENPDKILDFTLDLPFTYKTTNSPMGVFGFEIKKKKGIYAKKQTKQKHTKGKNQLHHSQINRAAS